MMRQEFLLLTQSPQNGQEIYNAAYRCGKGGRAK